MAPSSELSSVRPRYDRIVASPKDAHKLSGDRLAVTAPQARPIHNVHPRPEFAVRERPAQSRHQIPRDCRFTFNTQKKLCRKHRVSAALAQTVGKYLDAGHHVSAQNIPHQSKIDICCQHRTTSRRRALLSNTHRTGQGTGIATDRYTIRILAKSETHYFFPQLERFGLITIALRESAKFAHMRSRISSESVNNLRRKYGGYHPLAPHATDQRPYQPKQHRFVIAPISAADLLRRHNIKHLYTHWP
jgi:hypothetical protein